MKYRIEYADGRRCDFVDNRQELINCIRMAVPGAVEDIRKLYKSGVSDSVMEKYEMYIQKRPYQSR